MAAAKPNEINIIRVYDAPVKLVWDAWTDPKKAAKWWGPRGFTITTHSKDLRPGGIWHYTMHGPDGTDYPNKTLYHEVEKYSKLVYDHGGYDERKPLFRVTVTFEEFKGKTVMDMMMAFESEAARIEIGKFIKQASGNSTWDRLAEYVGDENGKDQFVINRTFNAPIDSVFKMWADPAHLSKWLPPSGFTMEFLRADFKTGGSSVSKMTDGKTVMFSLAKYIVISPVTRFVYTQTFIDEKENVSRHPMLPVFPESMINTVIFTEESKNLTRVTLTTEPYGKASAEEIAMFREIRSGMTMGWTGSFDKLEELLG